MAILGRDRTPALDVRQIVLAAVDAAFDQRERAQAKQRKRLPAARAVLVGAALMTAGRVAIGNRGRGLLDSLEERLGVFDDEGDERDDLDQDEEFDEPEAEAEPEPLEDEDEEPEGEEDEEPEAYEDDEDPEGYEEEEEPEEDEEPEASEEDEYEDEEPEASEDDGYEDEEPDDEEDAPRRERPRAGSRSKRRS